MIDVAKVSSAVRSIGRSYALVVLFTFLLVAVTGCVGESRFDGVQATSLLTSSENSEMYGRLQGEWVATATIGETPVSQRIHVKDTLIAVDVQGESSEFAIFDILSEGDDWAKIVILRPQRFSFSTLRMTEDGELWIEHYPHTHYRRQAGVTDSESTQSGEQEIE
jgi:hypothetical protein